MCSVLLRARHERGAQLGSVGATTAPPHEPHACASLCRYVVADDPKCGEERGSGAAAGDSLALDGVHETGSANRTIWNTLLELCLREDIALAELEAEPGKGEWLPVAVLGCVLTLYRW